MGEKSRLEDFYELMTGLKQRQACSNTIKGVGYV